MKIVWILVSLMVLAVEAQPMKKNSNQPLMLNEIINNPFAGNYAKTIKGDFLGQVSFDRFLMGDLWHFANPLESEIEGISVNKSYKSFKIPSNAPSVVVAVIDSGVDVRHNDLQGKIWVNADEILDNGLDDDNNGYIDDIFGWNFIGNKNGMAKITDDDNNLENGFSYELGDPSMQVVKDTLEVTRELLRMRALAQSRPLSSQEAAYLKQTEEDYAKNNDNSSYYDLTFNSRLIVDDNYADLYEKDYGNNDVIGDVEGSFHGTHVSGIIAANRLNEDSSMGIASNVKIMVIRVVPDGDERDKDVANGIRYAVDNGAKIINMSFGKGYKLSKKVVDEAVAYAEKKGVILVHAAGNSKQNNDVTPNFPNRMNKESILPNAEFGNWLEIGASGSTKAKLNASFSNYGQKTVDIFAPGVQIISTAPDNGYAPASGTSMASPVVAGILAAILNFVPSVTPLEAKNALLNSTRLYPGVEVFHAGERREFKTLSIKGGVADLYESIVYLKNLGHKVLRNDSDVVLPTKPKPGKRTWGSKTKKDR